MVTSATKLKDACKKKKKERKKGCLLLGRKALTNLDSILKSRDIILLTKVLIIAKTMSFPVDMHRCESWSIKNAMRVEELMHSDCGAGLLSVPWLQGNQTSPY